MSETRVTSTNFRHFDREFSNAASDIVEAAAFVASGGRANRWPPSRNVSLSNDKIIIFNIHLFHSVLIIIISCHSNSVLVIL